MSQSQDVPLTLISGGTRVETVDSIVSAADQGAQPSHDLLGTAWPKPSSLYLHVPFCPYKCPYCDFVTHVGSPSLVQPYIEALCCEIDLLAQDHPGQPVQTVYFGGGTPGMLSASQLGAVLQMVRETFGLSPTAEVTVETNPDTVDGAELAEMRRAGISRLSLGVQSLENCELKALGRGHSPDVVERAVDAARTAGFESLSLDLIYGIPQQTMATWVRTLESVLALAPDHLSLYALIVEPGTVFYRRHKQNNLPLPEDDIVADMYLRACDLLSSAGYIHYEVSNWSRPGLESRHNLAYWRNEEFFAAGVGAYDYLRPYRSVRIRSTARYIDRVGSSKGVTANRDFVSPENERFETVVMALRLLTTGLERSSFNQRFPEGLDQTYGKAIGEMVDLGFLEDDGATVRLRENMVPLANECWEKFLPTPTP